VPKHILNHDVATFILGETFMDAL